MTLFWLSSLKLETCREGSQKRRITTSLVKNLGRRSGFLGLGARDPIWKSGGLSRILFHRSGIVSVEILGSVSEQVETSNFWTSTTREFPRRRGPVFAHFQDVWFGCDSYSKLCWFVGDFWHLVLTRIWSNTSIQNCEQIDEVFEGASWHRNAIHRYAHSLVETYVKFEG